MKGLTGIALNLKETLEFLEAMKTIGVISSIEDATKNGLTFEYSQKHQFGVTGFFKVKTNDFKYFIATKHNESENITEYEIITVIPASQQNTK